VWTPDLAKGEKGARIDMIQSDLDRDGFHLLRGAFSDAECDRLLHEWQAASEANAVGVMRSATGAIYGARNILDLWPAAIHLMHQPALSEAVRLVLGSGFGLVRMLYFDKPPGESWALPWHKDLAIAVRNNRLPSEQFTCPTTKYGVPHVEAPTWLLERMLTARLHLDEVTEENGPLRVIPGSHRDGKESGSVESVVHVLCGRGDVLLMRPLLSHSSGHSHEGTTRHRRVLHLEFSADRDLTDAYEWHTFVAAGDSRSELDAAYRATDYWVDDFPGGPFVIRTDELCRELADLQWAFVTACNPLSQRLPGEANAARMVELENAVRGRWEYYHGRGVGRDVTWPTEPSLLIVGIEKGDAVELAKRFGQNAIVTGRAGEPATLRWVDPQRP
jgi:hypothetical protein